MNEARRDTGDGLVETPRARQAWSDYLALGADRSLATLLARYRSGAGSAPTRRMTTLKGWCRAFGWQARLAMIAGREAADVERRELEDRRALQEKAISVRQNRLGQYNKRWLAARQVIEARAADPALAGIPGGETGLLVAEPVFVQVYLVRGGEGDPAEEILIPTKERALVYKYAVDTGLLNELLKLEKQAAVEMGQWTERQEHSGEMTLIRRYMGVDVDQV